MATTTTKVARRTAGNDGGQHPDPRHLDADAVLVEQINQAKAAAEEAERPLKELKAAQERAHLLRSRVGYLEALRREPGQRAMAQPAVAKIERKLHVIEGDMQHEFDQRLVEVSRIPPTVEVIGSSAFGGKAQPNERWVHAKEGIAAATARRAKFTEAKRAWVAAIKAGVAPATAESELREALSRLGVVL
jgi:hypothetical protein